MQKIILSVLIPLYNNRRGIEKILNGLNTIDPIYSELIEIIISEDSEKSVLFKKEIINLKRKFKYFQYIDNKPKLGFARNWNKLISKSNGDYFWLLHHDEYWLPSIDLINNIIKNLTYKKDLYILPVKKINVKNIKNYKIILSQEHLPNKYIIKAFINNPINFINTNIIGPPSSLIVSKKYKQKYNEKLLFLIDVDYYIRLLKIINKKSIYIFKYKKAFIFSSQNNSQSITKLLGIKKNTIRHNEKITLMNKYSFKINLITFIKDKIYYFLYKINTTLNTRINILKILND